MGVIKNICNEYHDIRDEHEANNLISGKNRKRGYNQIARAQATGQIGRHNFIDDSETDEDDDDSESEEESDDYVIIEDQDKDKDDDDDNFEGELGDEEVDGDDDDIQMIEDDTTMGEE